MNEDFDLETLLATLPDFGLTDPIQTVESEFSKAARAYELALPRGYLSQSQVGLYLKCGRAYEFRYVLGMSSRGNSAMAQGTAVHATADILHKSMILQAPVGLDEMKAAYSDAHDKAFDPAHELELDEADTDLGVVKDRGMGLVELYRKAALGEYVMPVGKGETPGPALRPLYVTASERAVRTTVVMKDVTGVPSHEPVPIIAIMDVEEPHMVRDLKVRKKLPPATEAKNSLQLNIYAVVKEKPDVSIDALIKPSAKLPERYIRYEVTTTESSRDHAVNIFTEVADDIRAGRFRFTSPDNWWCSEGWCSYWNQCRGAKR